MRLYDGRLRLLASFCGGETFSEVSVESLNTQQAGRGRVAPPMSLKPRCAGLGKCSSSLNFYVAQVQQSSARTACFFGCIF